MDFENAFGTFTAIIFFSWVAIGIDLIFIQSGFTDDIHWGIKTVFIIVSIPSYIYLFFLEGGISDHGGEGGDY